MSVGPRPRPVLTVTAIVAVAACGLPSAAQARPTLHRAPATSAHAETFTIASTSPNSRKESIIATGLFTAGGVDIARKHNTSLLRLGDGTLTLHHPGGHETDKLHKKNCLVDGSGHGRYTFGGGTGDYTGITGHGRYHETFRAVLARTAAGACNKSANPVAYQLTIVAHGPAARA